VCKCMYIYVCVWVGWLIGREGSGCCVCFYVCACVLRVWLVGWEGSGCCVVFLCVFVYVTGFVGLIRGDLRFGLFFVRGGNEWVGG
jgi:hypothetical protein